MNTPYWIKIAASSKEELAAEAEKLIKQLGGYDAAQEALQEFEGMGVAKDANWVLEEKYVESELSAGDEKFLAEGETATGGEKAPPQDKKPGDGEKKEEPAPKKKKEPKPKKKKEPKKEPEVAAEPEKPKDKPAEDGPKPSITPEKKKETSKMLWMALGALLAAAGMGGMNLNRAIEEKGGLEKLMKAMEKATVEYIHEKTAPENPTATPEAAPSKTPGVSSQSPFNWKAQDRITGETLFDAQVQKLQKGIDSIKNKALKPAAQKRLNDWVYDSELAYRQVFLKEWHLPKIKYNRGA